MKLLTLLAVAALSKTAIWLNSLSQRLSRRFLYLPNRWHARTYLFVVGDVVYFAFEGATTKPGFGVVRYVGKDTINVLMSTGRLEIASPQWFWPLTVLNKLNGTSLKPVDVL